MGEKLEFCASVRHKSSMLLYYFNIKCFFLLLRHREVCQKSPDDICAYHDSTGDVKFSKTLPTPNYLCR